MAIIPQVPFAGVQGAKRVMIYTLDPTLTTPIIPVVLDMLPTQVISPFSAGFDVAENVVKTTRYTITKNTLLNFATTTSNAHKELDVGNVSGIISATPIAGFGHRIPTLGIFRRDLLVADIIEKMAATRLPHLVITPDWTMPRAFFQTISRTAGAADGEVVRMSIDFIEARVISPTLAAGNVDASAMTGGAQQTVSGGAQGGTAIATPDALAGGALG